jgi:hypothetical protein
MSDFKWEIVFNQSAINAGDFMVPKQANDTYGDLTSLSTLAGQNSSPPAEKFFGSHYIVQVDLTGVTPSFYDPSYGVTYSGPDDFEDKAIVGYAKQASQDPDKVYRVKKSAGLHNISFFQ